MIRLVGWSVNRRFFAFLSISKVEKFVFKHFIIVRTTDGLTSDQRTDRYGDVKRCVPSALFSFQYDPRGRVHFSISFLNCIKNNKCKFADQQVNGSGK